MLVAALGLMLQVGGEPAIISRARVDTRAEVSFHALAHPATVYVGEAVNYELGVFISDGLRQLLRRNPEFVPPDLRSVLAYDIRERVASRMVEIEGRGYEVHVFRRALFPVAPGRIDIPPARLTYTVPLGPSFFSREETRTLQSEAVSFVAIAPPTAGRPAGWNGAVGNLSLEAVIASRQPRVGNPAVVTLRVSGTGNVHLWPRPDLRLHWATVVDGAERVVIDTLATRVRGTKEFDFLVTPATEGRSVVPPVAYVFFDPASRSYRTAESRAEVITVGAGELAPRDTAEYTAPAAIRPVLRRAWSRPLPDAPDRHWWYWVLAFAATIPALIRRWHARAKTRATSAAAEQLSGLAVRRGTPAADVQRVLKHALERRLAGVDLSWADARGLRRALRHCGVTDGTGDRVLALIADLDSVTYGGDALDLPDAAERALALFRAVDEEAQRAPSAGRRFRRTAVILLLLVPAPALAQASGDARELFQSGIAAYDADDAAAAAVLFLEAARRAPAAAAAWANAGTASWVAADTALAVAAWQQALRLNPLDRETRNRLARVGADAGSARSAVWPLPRRALAWIALVLWAGALVLLARGRSPRLAISGAVLGVAFSAVSVLHGRRLSDPSVAVMGASTSLRALPALGADAGPAPLTGEIVQITARSGVWVHIEAPGGRQGWIDGARVLGLDGRPLRD